MPRKAKGQRRLKKLRSLQGGKAEKPAKAEKAPNSLMIVVKFKRRTEKVRLFVFLGGKSRTKLQANFAPKP